MLLIFANYAGLRQSTGECTRLSFWRWLFIRGALAPHWLSAAKHCPNDSLPQWHQAPYPLSDSILCVGLTRALGSSSGPDTGTAAHPMFLLILIQEAGCTGTGHLHVLWQFPPTYPPMLPRDCLIKWLAISFYPGLLLRLGTVHILLWKQDRYTKIYTQTPCDLMRMLF
jgi:hypothetical protein